MAFKGISVVRACIIVLALLIFSLLLRRQAPTRHPKTHHIIAINKLLHKLRGECVTGQIDVAQNTIEDVRQEWEYLDVVLRTQAACSSDSLQALDSLVTLMLNKDESKRLLPIVLAKINIVNNRLDKLH
ncbi:hypothetical protein [Dyadobacter jiangsuensis]|uniref:Uncharacterized protein n=1 Tax=Dyadobacter jiangsuensis TaxID=1591085 RepID=A0A2P8FTW3_9BACT|nr:hypothetical protein [Dyadobacter jiangsuensis]PSL25167.1 hypothetical protein CLV60_11286 [Dyadobacter jiangsuensis]